MSVSTNGSEPFIILHGWATLLVTQITMTGSGLEGHLSILDTNASVVGHSRRSYD